MSKHEKAVSKAEDMSVCKDMVAVKPEGVLMSKGADADAVVVKEEGVPLSKSAVARLVATSQPLVWLRSASASRAAPTLAYEHLEPSGEVLW